MIIDLRPAVVAERGRFGDWEGDRVIGAGQKQALVTLNERTSRYTLIAHVPKKTAQAVARRPTGTQYDDRKGNRAS